MSDYLWDRSGPVDPDVAEVEAQLRPLAFDPAKHPLAMPPSRPTSRTRRRRPLLVGAILLAASIAIVAGLWEFHVWRLAWPEGRAWSVDSGAASLAPGQSLTVGAAGAEVDIARLGILTARPGTEISLQETSPTRHRMTLTHGEIDVRVWAPPGRIGVHTPAGEVVDLGCIFRLSVDDNSVTHLHVDTGWVNLRNAYGEQFVPAGASAEMRADRAPTVPVYDDASDLFRRAVIEIETNAQSPDPVFVKAVAFEARERDALTLLLLADADNIQPLAQAVILERLSILSSAPTPDAITRIVAGDRDMYWKWYDSLPLPPLKNWWLNWRDVFPRKSR